MKWVLLIVGVVVVSLLGWAIFWWYSTKSLSPENSVVFQDATVHISIIYNRPYKKGRVIFGGLVPYGKTWRTGANEATVFESNKDLLINGKILAQGKYSFWTVPNEDSWLVIFNSKIPPWGIDVMKNGEAARDPDSKEVILEIPVVISPKEIEQFTITIEKAGDSMELVLLWDRTLVAVPFSVNGQ